MAWIYEWGFFVKPGMRGAFLEWLAANEAKLYGPASSGYEYLGTFVPVWNSERRAEDFRQLWRHGSREARDPRAVAKEETGAFAGLITQMLTFVDDGRIQEESLALQRSATEAPVRSPVVP
ncbi:MAG: hypothetical protein ACRDI0_09925 [Actinomycetota bacterium]